MTGEEVGFCNNERRAGVMMPLTSVPGPDFTGTMGDEARELIDLLRQAQVQCWQDLPSTVPDEFGSPYSGLSGFAGDPRRIDLGRLVEVGDLKPNELDDYYKRVSSGDEEFTGGQAKQDILRRASRRFCEEAGLDRQNALITWSENQSWLHSYAALISLLHGSPDISWQDFRERYPSPATDSTQGVANTEEYRAVKYGQWVFDGQAGALKRYAGTCDNEGGRVIMIGDAPIYVGAVSADVWANPHIFQLDDEGNPLIQAGCPPDGYAKEGQLWKNPIYRWHEKDVKSDLYNWWAERFERLFELSDVARIDHFRGLDKYYAVNAGETTAKNGWWQEGPGSEFLEFLEDTFGLPIPLIAEDLGTITQSVRDLRDKHHLPGMVVAQFAPWGKKGFNHSKYNPDNYNSSQVAYSGTHDSPTTMQWFRELKSWQKQHVRAYFGTDDAEIARKMIETIWTSGAGTAITPMADILQLGAEARINTPGEEDVTPPNWSWRLNSFEEFKESVEWLRHITKESGRIALSTTVR